MSGPRPPQLTDGGPTNELLQAIPAFLPQGLEADLLRRMLVRVHDVLSIHTGYRSKVVLSMHDELLLEVGGLVGWLVGWLAHGGPSTKGVGPFDRRSLSCWSVGSEWD